MCLQAKKCAKTGTSPKFPYDKNGNITRKDIGDLTKFYTYNKAGLCLSESDYGYTAYDMYYQYYLDGNLKYKREAWNYWCYYYVYDGMSRLSEVSEGYVEYPYSHTNFYSYDKFGNRTQKKTEEYPGDVKILSYEYDNNLLSLSTEAIESDGVSSVIKSTQYNYNSSGNLTGKTIYNSDNAIESQTLYSYDFLNRLSNINPDGTISLYTYNGDNLRQSKTVNNQTTTHILDGAYVVADLESSSANKFIYGTQLEFICDNSSSTWIYFSDNQDVKRMYQYASDDYYSINFTYDEFGNDLTYPSSSDSVNNPFGYRGEYHDEETGLIYLRNRYYDPETGRFITEDPVMDGLNWYVYCGNDPVNKVDPFGLSIFLTGDIKYWESTINDLKMLTNDEIDYYKDTGEVYIKNTKSGKKITGSKLVSDLIKSDYKISISRNSMNKSGEKFLANEVVEHDEEGAWININDASLSDMKFLTENSEGEIILENAPSYIAVGHELIHSYHYMNNTFNGKQIGYRYYRNSDGELVHESMLSLSRVDDEFETIGLGYLTYIDRPNNRSMYSPSREGGLRWIQSGYNEITENSIRMENGLNRRIAY